MIALDTLPTETPATPWNVPQKEIFGIDRKDISKELSYMGEYKGSHRLVGCRKKYFLSQCTNCGKPEVSGSQCKSKVCPECGEEKLKGLIVKEKDFLKAIPSRRAAILTLTIKNVSDSNYSSSSYKELRNHFNKFLKHPQIKGKIRGGIYSIETKRPPVDYVYKKKDGSSYWLSGDRTWNLHIHALVDMDYVPQKIISAIWRKITCGSHVVDVRGVKSNIPALVEVLKYVTKPPNLGDAESYARYIIETKNVHLMVTFGTFYGHFKVTEKGEYLCSLCGCGMEFITKITEKEALRWEQFIKGPPLDIFSRFNDMGYPNLMVLRYHGPGLKPWEFQQTTKMEV